MTTHHSSTQKKSSSKSHHVSATAADATPKAPSSHEVAEAEAPVVSSGQPAPKATISANDAVAQLNALESKLNLDIVIRPNDKDQIRALNRVSDTALGLASDLVSSDPARFSDFADLPASASYVTTMSPLAARAATLATHLQKSVQNQRTPASQQTLALYTVVKGLGRIVTNETMREKVGLLKAELAPVRKNPKPKVTKAEKAAKRAAGSLADRIAKAQKLLADNGVGTTATSQQPAPAAAPASPVAATVQSPAPATASPAPQPASVTPAPPATH